MRILSVMFKNILSPNQVKILPLVKCFSGGFYLVGGTAIALQIGHRQSIDFDLFSFKPINREKIKKVIADNELDYEVIFEDGDQLHGIISDTKMTFYEYPYPIEHGMKFEEIISMPSLLTLGAMKVFALGQRAKWKDYVDVYFLLKNHFTLEQISDEAEKIFEGGFNAKLLRQQLLYYADVDYREPIEYVVDQVPNEEIEKFLTIVATEKI